VAAFVLLGGNFVGYFMNVVRWKFIQSLIKTDLEFIQRVTFMLIPIAVITGLAMIIVGIKLKGKIYTWNAKDENPGETGEKPKVPWYALVSPVVPLAVILISTHVFKKPVDINAAIIIGMIYVTLTMGWRTKWKGMQELFNRSLFDAFANVSIVIGLFFGIGMVLNAAKQPELTSRIGAILQAVVPESPLGLIIVFGIIGPFFCMYRGPLNPWGLGAAVAGMLTGSTLPLGFLVAMFWIYDYYVGVGDPTASQVVWSTGYLEHPVRSYVLQALPYNVAFVLIGMIFAVMRFVVFA
jgi:hypothetical protein